MSTLVAEYEIRDETWQVHRRFNRPQPYEIVLWVRGWMEDEFPASGKPPKEATWRMRDVITPDRKCHLDELLPFVLEHFKSMTNGLFVLENAGITVYRRKRACR